MKNMFGIKVIVLSIISCLVSHSYAEENLYLTPGIRANVTQFRYFECHSESGPQIQLTSTFTIESDGLSCNVFTYDNKNITFDLKMDNQTHQLVAALNSYTVSLNGNSIFMLNGKIESGVCAGGQLDELTFSLADDQNGCLSKGLMQSTPVYSSLRISGGKCESECSGGVTTVYDPPIVNTSNDISFKSCEE